MFHRDAFPYSLYMIIFLYRPRLWQDLFSRIVGRRERRGDEFIASGCKKREQNQLFLLPFALTCALIRILTLEWIDLEYIRQCIRADKQLHPYLIESHPFIISLQNPSEKKTLHINLTNFYIIVLFYFFKIYVVQLQHYYKIIIRFRYGFNAYLNMSCYST